MCRADTLFTYFAPEYCVWMGKSRFSLLSGCDFNVRVTHVCK